MPGIDEELKSRFESEQQKAMLNVIQEAYVKGVSTRKVESLATAMGITNVDKSTVSRACVELDTQANQRHATRISRHGSRVSAWVIPTNEELMVARHTGRLLGLT